MSTDQRHIGAVSGLAWLMMLGDGGSTFWPVIVFSSGCWKEKELSRTTNTSSVMQLNRQLSECLDGNRAKKQRTCLSPVVITALSVIWCEL